MIRRLLIAAVVLAVLGAGFTLYFFGRSYWVPVYQKVVGQRTVADVVSVYGAEARERLAPHFSAVGVPYPPKRVALLGLKDTAELQVWAETAEGPKFVHTYPIRALSGVSGPKLREGDGQVPEGIYRIDGLNPNSAYHLSLKLNYPNDFDLKHANAEGRIRPGSNIFIHGKAVSIGCLAMGDRAIEELFVLAVDVGRENIQVAIAPTDPRTGPLPATNDPPWVGKLYSQLTAHFERFRQ